MRRTEKLSKIRPMCLAKGTGVHVHDGFVRCLGAEGEGVKVADGPSWSAYRPVRASALRRLGLSGAAGNTSSSETLGLCLHESERFYGNTSSFLLAMDICDCFRADRRRQQEQLQ